MGILGDILSGKKKIVITDNKEEVVEVPESEPIKANIYNRSWLDKKAMETGFAISDNDARVDNILKKLNDRDGHCPCGGMTDEFICPCRMMREHGNCKCGLYNNVVDVEPKNSSTSARIKGE